MVSEKANDLPESATMPLNQCFPDPLRMFTVKPGRHLELARCEGHADPVPGIDGCVPSALTSDEQPRTRVTGRAPFDHAPIVESDVAKAVCLKQQPQRGGIEMPEVIVTPAEHERPTREGEQPGVATLEREVGSREPERPAVAKRFVYRIEQMTRVGYVRDDAPQRHHVEARGRRLYKSARTNPLPCCSRRLGGGVVRVRIPPGVDRHTRELAYATPEIEKPSPRQGGERR